MVVHQVGETTPCTPGTASSSTPRRLRPTSIDVSFAYGGVTGSGGHPIGIVRRNVRRGIWDEDQGEGAFHYAVDDTADLRQKGPTHGGRHARRPSW